MPETSSKTESRSPFRGLLALFERKTASDDVPEKLAHRMQHMERDLSRRLPERGLFKS